jgi:hypothetical protein
MSSPRRKLQELAADDQALQRRKISEETGSIGSRSIELNAALTNGCASIVLSRSDAFATFTGPLQGPGVPPNLSLEHFASAFPSTSVSEMPFSQPCQIAPWFRPRMPVAKPKFHLGIYFADFRS